MTVIFKKKIDKIKMEISRVCVEFFLNCPLFLIKMFLKKKTLENLEISRNFLETLNSFS